MSLQIDEFGVVHNAVGQVMVDTGQYRLAEHPNGRLFLQRAMAPMTGGQIEWQEVPTVSAAQI